MLTKGARTEWFLKQKRPEERGKQLPSIKTKNLLLNEKSSYTMFGILSGMTRYIGPEGVILFI